MCGRYTLKSRADVVADVFGVPVPPTLPERFNIAPYQQVLAIREQPGSHQRELVALKWGLIPFWADEPDIGRLSKLLRPFHPDEMTAYPVSKLVNNVRNDSAGCIEPVSQAPEIS